MNRKSTYASPFAPRCYAILTTCMIGVSISLLKTVSESEDMSQEPEKVSGSRNTTVGGVVTGKDDPTDRLQFLSMLVELFSR